MNKKYISLTISILLTLIIFSMSLFTGTSSGEVSSGFTMFLKGIIDTVFANNQISLELLHRLVRKGAHIFEYFVLGLSYFFTAKAFGLSILKILFIGLSTAAIDEIIQTFVPDRAGRLLDVLAFDFGGFVLGFSLMLLLFNRTKEHSKQYILDQIESGDLTLKKGYRYLYKQKNVIDFTNNAHFIKLKVDIEEEKGASRFLNILFLIPFPIFIVKFAFLFVKENVTSELSKTDILKMINTKGINLNINTISGERITIKTI